MLVTLQEEGGKSLTADFGKQLLDSLVVKVQARDLFLSIVQKGFKWPHILKAVFDFY